MKNFDHFYKSAIFCLLFGSLLISFSPFFVEFSNLDAFSNSFYRSLIGGILFLAIAMCRRDKFPPASVFILSLLAGVVISIDLIFLNQSVIFIGSGLGTLLANLEIVFLVLISVCVFRERLKALFLVTCSMIIFGIYLLIQPYFYVNHPHIGLGIITAVSASIFFSIYLMMLKIITSKNRKNNGSMIILLGIICLTSALVSSFIIMLNPLSTFVIPNLTGLGCVLLNGVISQVLGWILITYGIKNLPLSISGVMMLAQPALTFFFDCLIFKRNTHGVQIIGATIVLIGIYFTMLIEKKNKPTVLQENV